MKRKLHLINAKKRRERLEVKNKGSMDWFNPIAKFFMGYGAMLAIAIIVFSYINNTTNSISKWLVLPCIFAFLVLNVIYIWLYCIKNLQQYFKLKKGIKNHIFILLIISMISIPIVLFFDIINSNISIN